MQVQLCAMRAMRCIFAPEIDPCLSSRLGKLQRPWLPAVEILHPEVLRRVFAMLLIQKQTAEEAQLTLRLQRWAEKNVFQPELTPPSPSCCHWLQEASVFFRTVATTGRFPEVCVFADTFWKVEGLFLFLTKTTHKVHLKKIMNSV